MLLGNKICDESFGIPVTPQVFSCEFYRVFQSNFFMGNLGAATSVYAFTIVRDNSPSKEDLNDSDILLVLIVFPIKFFDLS